MFLLKKDEWKEVWSVARIIILVILGFGFVTGFMVGAFESGKKDSCTYDSLISRLNIGYVSACELWRPRWEEPKKCVMKTVIAMNPTYKDSTYYAIVFDDGSTATEVIPADMLNKKLMRCDK